MLRPRALVALLLLAQAAAPVARCGELILDGVKVLGDESPEAEARDWSACQVRAELIQTGPDGTRTLLSENRLLILGENLDLEDTVTLSQGGRYAIVRLQVRLRASTVLPDGVMYLVTSEGELQAAVGYSPRDSSRNQFRHDFLEISAPIAQLREVHAIPELGLRVLLAVTATPIDDEVEEPLFPAPPEAANILQFRVESKRRIKGRDTVLRHVVLQATVGRPASLGIMLRDGKEPPPDAPAKDPAHPYGRSISVADIGYKPDSGFADGHVVGRREADRDYLSRNAVGADQSYLERHAVELGEGPERTTLTRPKRRKLSEKKRESLKAAAEIQAVQAMALERQKTIAGGEGAPAPRPTGEGLEVTLTPLRTTERHIRLEVRLQGALSLAPDQEPSPVDLSFVENVAWGETLELALRSLLQGGEPEDDTIVAITPQP